MSLAYPIGFFSFQTRIGGKLCEATLYSGWSARGVANAWLIVLSHRLNGGASNFVRQPIVFATVSKSFGQVMAKVIIASSAKTLPGAISSSEASSLREIHRSLTIVSVSRSLTLCMPDVLRQRSVLGSSEKT